MNIIEDFRNRLCVALQNKNLTQLTKEIGIPRNSLSYFLKGERKGLDIKTFSKVADYLGLSLSCSDTTREVCFVDSQLTQAGEGLDVPNKEDYFAVPLVEEVGAGAGIIPQEEVLSWVLVWKWQEGVRNRSSNLIAVQIAKGANSMEPLLYPGDIVLIDRNDRNINVNNRVWLVKDPLDGSCMIKRVVTNRKDNDTIITFLSDNIEYPPLFYSLNNDFYGDWTNCIAGRVIWAWTDISNK